MVSKELEMSMLATSKKNSKQILQGEILQWKLSYYLPQTQFLVQM